MASFWPRWSRRARAVALLALALYPLAPGLDVALDRALGLPVQLERLLLSAFVFALLTLAVHLQLGLGGLMQLGAAAFYGVGAYAVGLATVEKLPFQLPFSLALAVALAAGGLFGALLGALSARVEGDALAMVTLSFAEIWRATALNADGITDGSRGLNPLGQPSPPAWLAPWLGPGDRPSFVVLYWCALGAVGLAAAGLGRLARRPLGRSLAAMRADPLAAASQGLSILHLRVLSMALGGSLAALGGGLYATYLTTTAEPSTYDYNISVMALCAVVLGGARRPAGAIAGAALVVVFDAALSPIVTALVARTCAPETAAAAWANFANWRWLVFGGLLIATMRVAPNGWLERAHR